MRDELLQYYEKELRYIRRLAGEFAQRYPGVAGQLLLEPDKCEDPHVERLIEAFALLTARVQLKLDDEFSEITSALLETLYPQHLAPLPSATVVQLTADPGRAEATTALRIPSHTVMFARPVGGVRCRFRTCYPVDLWPVELTGASVVPLDRNTPGCPPQARAALRLELRALGGQSLPALAPGCLRFHLTGEGSLPYDLYELLLRDPLGLLVRPAAPPGGGAAARRPSVFLAPDNLRPVGFERDEGLVDAGPGRLGCRLVQEYFCFPEKFLFVDVAGLTREVLAACGNTVEILVLLDHHPLDMAATVGPVNFKLGCTPAVNLFPMQAEPVALTHTTAEHQVIPDSHQPLGYEVHSIQSVETVTPGSGVVRAYRPFHALRHGDRADEEPAFYLASRRPSTRKDDEGSEVFLTLVDRDRHPLREPPGETLIVRALCTNRDVPARLPLGEERGDFQIEGQPGVARIRSLRSKPTPALRLPARREGLWRLVSLLQLNHLSLVGGTESLEGRPGMQDPGALRELLAQLDGVDSAATRQRIAGLVGLRARHVLRLVDVEASSLGTPVAARPGGSAAAPVAARAGRIFARGLEVTLELDESKYAGSGAFLFAAVLERFLGLYTTINSFTQTVVLGRQREGVLKRWPPRAGEVPLL